MIILIGTIGVDIRIDFDGQSTCEGNDSEPRLLYPQSSLHYSPKNLALILKRFLKEHPRISNIPRSGSPGRKEDGLFSSSICSANFIVAVAG